MKSKIIKLWLHGISGRMGQELQQQIQQNAKQFTLVGGSDKQSKPNEILKKLGNAEVILDFSSSDGNKQLLKILTAAKITHKTVLVGSTGLNADQHDAWRKLSKNNKLKLLFAPNTSLGIFVLNKITQQIAKTLFDFGFDIEIAETHHRLKEDAPSGTAKLLAESIASITNPKLKIITDRIGKRPKNAIGVQSFRGGAVFGEHEIKFLGDHEELYFKHRALSRALFAKGALLLAVWLVNKKTEAVYEFKDVELY